MVSLKSAYSQNKKASTNTEAIKVPPRLEQRSSENRRLLVCPCRLVILFNCTKHM